MSEPPPRLKARIWIAAMIRQAEQRGSFGAIRRHGDDDAGGILLVLRDRANRVTVLDQTRDADGNPAWLRVRREVEPDDADAFIARALSRDPDLWVAEFDAEDGVPPFEASVVD